LHVAPVIALLLLLLAPLAVSAQAADAPAEAEESLVIPGGEEAETAAAPEPAGPLVSSWDFVRMLRILVAVVGVIYLIFWLIRRGFRRQLPQNDIIRLLGTRNLSGSRALHLVGLGRSVFLGGSAESGVNLISEVKDPETLDQIRLESSAASGPPQGFSQFFQSLWKPGGRQNPKGEGLAFMKQQRRRLEKM